MVLGHVPGTPRSRPSSHLERVLVYTDCLQTIQTAPTRFRAHFGLFRHSYRPFERFKIKFGFSWLKSARIGIQSSYSRYTSLTSGFLNQLSFRRVLWGIKSLSGAFARVIMMRRQPFGDTAPAAHDSHDSFACMDARLEETERDVVTLRSHLNQALEVLGHVTREVNLLNTEVRDLYRQRGHMPLASVDSAEDAFTPRDVNTPRYTSGRRVVH